ncbi:MAG: WYL domain-containing protein [Ruminococcaceae bacterium]|nr:WYL domain-containing protein [Oscillospiraceae bacterium]
MPKESNQKLKMLYLLKILSENTDETHHMGMNEIIDKLALNGIKAERKSIYSDIEELKFFGVDIICEKNKTFGYYIGSRDFELPELKLLVDSVQCSKFITEKKSLELIHKLEALTSRHNANKLQRQVYVADRVKNLSEIIYYNVDSLHEAIYDGYKIAFKYYEYSPDKERVLRNNGDDYVVSPYSLTYSDDNYYLICHYPKHEGGLSHFRVDKMADIRILKEKCEDVRTVTDEDFNLGEYSKKIFSMYAGKTQTVQILCHNSVINPVIDRFGENVMVRKEDDEHFIVTAKIFASPTFFAWVFTFGDRMKIISPTDTVDRFKEMIKGVYNNYEETVQSDDI